MVSCAGGMRRTGFALLLLSGLFNLACSNDDATLVLGLTNPGGAEVSLARDVQPIFDASCARSGCHAGSEPQSSMSLEAGQAFDPTVGIVNVPSLGLPSMPRVTPSDPALSYLFHKIEGTHIDVGGDGDRMPAEAPPLPDSARTTIRRWIEQGATDN